MARLEVKELTVRFGGVLALDSVSLEVVAGRVSGLIGPNGAGKTTLFNVATGLQSPTRGRVLLDDRDITSMSPHRRARLGLARTFQRLELFGTLTVRENVQLAAETMRRRLPAGSSPDEMTDALLEKVGLTAVGDEPADVLPTGLARLVELARSLATTPSVLLLDEPSVGLNQDETSQLGEVLTSLAVEGMAVLLVEHDMSLVMGVCDPVTVLDFGSVIAHGDPAAVRGDDAVQLAYLGTADVEPDGARGEGEGLQPSGPVTDPAPTAALIRGRAEVRDRPGRASLDASSTPSVIAPPLEGAPGLELEEVHAAYGRIEVVHGVSLSVPEGGVLALLGPNGAGKTTLLKVASGQMHPTTGSVRLFGGSYAGTASDRMARRGLCAMLEGRGVFPNLTVAENLLMYTYRSKDIEIEDLEERSYKRFPVLGHRRRQLAGHLSGGEQQMLALARALYTGPRVLLLDELSMGLAPRVVTELYELVAEAVCEEHLTVLIVEQFAQTALALSDRAVVMVNGRIVRGGTPEEVGAELMRTYMGAAG